MAEPRLRVALDVTALIAGDTGVARYSAEHLANLEGRDDIEVRPFTIGRGDGAPMSVRRSRLPLRVVHQSWRWLRWPSVERLVGPVDVVHSIDMVPPPSEAPLVVTVHDVLPLRLPALYGPRFIRIAERGLRDARRARVVLADSGATRDELVACGIAAHERIVVAPPGRRAERGLTEPLIPPPYILAVGSITPRKGFDTLADALALLDPITTPPVVIAGPDGWRANEVRHHIAASGVAGRIRLLGRVDDDELERLFRHAALLCHPSVAEGFGIPCLEALGFGVPVVATDIPPVRELARGCADLVPVGAAPALADAIRHVLEHPGEAKAKAERGRRAVEPQTWAAMTDKIVEAYRHAVG